MRTMPQSPKTLRFGVSYALGFGQGAVGVSWLQLPESWAIRS